MTNLSTQIANELLELTSQLPRVQASMTRDLKKAFAEYQAEMLAAVAKADIMGVSARRYQEKRALALVKSVRELTTKTYRDIHKTTEAQLIDLAGVSTETMVATMNKVAQGELLTKTLTSPQMKQLVKQSVIDGATSAEWWGKQAANTQFKFKSVVQDALLKGEGTDVITRGVRGTRANNYTDGFMNTSFSNARSLVHTSVQNVANESRLETMQENDDVIEGIEWLSTLDGHTTQICKSLDGLVWDMNHKPVGHSQEWVGATAHWQCRSTQVPVLKGYNELSTGKQIEMKSVRANMDGKPISGDIDYNEWLKEKDIDDPAFVMSTLGSKKYELWRKHDLSMTDMVDQYNNPLTVEQLRRKFGSVTAKKAVKKSTVKKVETKTTVKAGKYTTGTIKIMPKKKAVSELETAMHNASVDSRYIDAPDGLPMTRFGYRTRQRQEFGKVYLPSLTEDATSAVLQIVGEADAIVSKYGVQSIRGVTTKVSRNAWASMGDGILRLDKKFFNKGVVTLDKAKTAKKAATIKKKMEVVETELNEIRDELNKLKETLGVVEASRTPAYRNLGIMYNKKVDSYNRYYKQTLEWQPRNTEYFKHEWKVGDPLKDRPHNALEFFDEGVDSIRNTIYHEYGHQVHQQYNVKTISGYQAPPLERVLDKIITNKSRVTPTRYADTNYKEFFAESFSLYHMGRKDLLDPVFIKLMESLENDTFDKFALGFL